MSKSPNLEYYNLILIRYNEIWLKSTKVKIRMLKSLMRNIKNMLQRSEIPFHKYHLSKDSTRVLFFFKNEDILRAAELLKRVFGIHSFSPALKTSSNLKNIVERILEVSDKVLNKGDTFALRVKRSGKHDFSSKDVAIKGGKAILDNFKELNLKVNLTSPKKKIFVEVRGEFSYIFTEIIKSVWGGMPIEQNKNIFIMDVGRLSDLLAGFLIARRGSQIYPVLFDLTEKDFEMRLSNWKKAVLFMPNFKFTIIRINLARVLEEAKKRIQDPKNICSICRLVRFEIISRLLKDVKIENHKRIKAITDGVSLNDFKFCPDNVDLGSIALNHLFSGYPIFTPVIGLDSDQIKLYLSKISNNLQKIDYCKFKPKNQEIDIEKLKSLYYSLNLNEAIEEAITRMEKYNII